MKANLVAQFSSGNGFETEGEKIERLKVEDIIKETDRLIAIKDEEIADLQQIIEKQSSGSFGPVASGAAAVAEILGKDEMIVQERERLAAMKDEWEDKLRQAEVQLSQQWADISREKSKLEERLALVDKLERQKIMESTENGEATEKKSNKWLARLGLKSGQDEEEQDQE